MLSQRSLRKRFLIEIAVSMTAMLITISAILAYFLFTNLYDDAENELERQAHYLISNYKDPELLIKEFSNFEVTQLYKNSISIVDSNRQLGTHLVQKRNQYYLELVTPYPVSKNILKFHKMLQKRKIYYIRYMLLC